jgi:hypothetical protein
MDVADGVAEGNGVGNDLESSFSLPAVVKACTGVMVGSGVIVAGGGCVTV